MCVKISFAIQCAGFLCLLLPSLLFRHRLKRLPDCSQKRLNQKYAGGNGTEAVALNDQWDYHDVSRSYPDVEAAGGMRPVVNSHYARQLNMWSIPVALTGQQFDARDPRGATLRFDRRDRSMRRWPILTPLGMGVASLAESGATARAQLSLKLTFGVLKLKELYLDGALVGSDLVLKAGEQSLIQL